MVHDKHDLHSEKKWYQNGASGVLLPQMVPFFQRGTLFSLIIMFVEKKSIKYRKNEKIKYQRMYMFDQTRNEKVSL